MNSMSTAPASATRTGACEVLVAPGVTLSCDDRGSPAAVPVLLIHGHPFNRSMWRPQVDALVGAGYRVIVPDLRGYGESTVVPGTTLLSDFARDLADVLDRLGT